MRERGAVAKEALCGAVCCRCSGTLGYYGVVRVRDLAGGARRIRASGLSSLSRPCHPAGLARICSRCFRPRRGLRIRRFSSPTCWRFSRCSRRFSPNPMHCRCRVRSGADLSFRNVSFAYPGTERRVLSNFNFTLEPDERVALIGENGQGKTTIVKLITRLYDPTEGADSAGRR